MTDTQTARHDPDDYHCIKWTGDRAGTNLRARCPVCALPGYKEAHAARKTEEASHALGVLGAIIGVLVIVIGLAATAVDQGWIG